MSSSSKRSCAPAATAPRFPFPPLAQLCLNELLTRDGDLARYLQQDSLLARGKLQTTDRMAPPEMYRWCSFALEDLYRQRPRVFSMPELLGTCCQHPRCVGHGLRHEIGLGRVPFLPRYLQDSGGGYLLWVCHPEQPFSICRLNDVQDWYTRKARGNGQKLVVWDLERSSGI